MIKDRTGEVYTFSDGRTMTIINTINNKNIDVLFNDGTIVKRCYYSAFLDGEIKNNNNPIIYNKGYVGYGCYKTRINGKQPLSYVTWKNLLNRCYRPNRQIKQKSYLDCIVHPDWHNFQVFSKWFEENYVDGFEIDKDILFKGNKVYGPETCCFVPQELNILFTNRKSKRGKYAIGVTFYKKMNKYMSYVSIDGVLKHLGYFFSEIDAFNAYKETKEQNIKNVANKFKDKITDQCYNALMNWTIDIND